MLICPGPMMVEIGLLVVHFGAWKLRMVVLLSFLSIILVATGTRHRKRRVVAFAGTATSNRHCQTA